MEEIRVRRAAEVPEHPKEDPLKFISEISIPDSLWEQVTEINAVTTLLLGIRFDLTRKDFEIVIRNGFVRIADSDPDFVLRGEEWVMRTLEHAVMECTHQGFREYERPPTENAFSASPFGIQIPDIRMLIGLPQA